MNCRSVEKFLPGSVDGQVGAFRAWWIERHLRRCPACAAKREELVALRAQVRAELPRYRAPAQLRTRVAALLANAPAAAQGAGRSARDRWQYLTAGALAGCAATLIALAAGNAVLQWRAQHDVGAEAVAIHVRATLNDQLIEVASSDQHTVKPWISSHLDYSPPVPDMTSAGFALLGARREQLHGQSVATLVYRYRQHTIDVFVRPEPARAPLDLQTLRGFHLAHANGSGMDWLAVSDVSPDVLVPFVQQLARGGASKEP